MKKYDGSLEDLLPITRGDVELSLKLILPIIKTLKILSELSIPIYHRDLKLDNILYKCDEEDNYTLYLLIFGSLMNTTCQKNSRMTHLWLVLI